MSYSNEYDESSPADNEQIRYGPTAIRQLKAAISERIADIVSGWSTGPLVLRPNIVTESSIVNEAVTENKIADDSLSTLKYKDGSVTEDKLAPGAVTIDKLGPGAIATANIADDSVTNVKIHDVDYSKVANVVVKTANIEDHAITSLKLADNSVGAAQIGVGAIMPDKIPDGTITAAKFATGAVSFSGYVSGAQVNATVPGTFTNNLNNGVGFLTVPWAGVASSDTVIFQWINPAAMNVGQGEEVLVQPIAGDDQVTLFFKDTGLGPTDITGMSFRLTRLRITP